MPRPAPALPVLGFPLLERSPLGLRGPDEPDRSGVGLFTAPSCPSALHERKDLYLKTTTPRGTEAPRGVLCVRRCPTLPQVPTCSTIGAERLSFRVRNGAGRFPFAMITVTLWSYCRTSPVGGGSRPLLENRTVDAYIFVGEQALGLLVSVSSMHCCTSTSDLSTRWSSGGLTRLFCGNPHLETCFPLRCFQRLSLPNVANQPCPWQDNWHTRGLSVPVLSY